MFSFGLHDFLVTCLVTFWYIFHVSPFFILYVSLMRTMFHYFTFSDSAVPLDPTLLCFTYHTQIPLLYPALLHPILSIYISCTCTTNLRINITCSSPHLSLRLPLEHLKTPAWPWSSLVSSCLDLVSLAHILVWIVDSYPLDSFTCLPLGIEFSGCGMY